MKNIITIVILLVLVTGSIAAQDVDNPLYCEGAQEWFDSAIPHLTAMLNGIELISPSSTPHDLRVAFNNMRDSYNEAGSISFPECVELPREDLMMSYLYFISSVDEYSKTEDQFAAIGPAVKAWRLLGKSQGHLEAIGVNSEVPSE